MAADQAWYRVPLRCLACGAITPALRSRLYSCGLSPDVRGIEVSPGDLLPVADGDFDIGFFRLRSSRRPAGAALRAVETSPCGACGMAQYALVTFVQEASGFRLATVEEIALSAAHAPIVDLVSERTVRELEVGARPEDLRALAALGIPPGRRLA